MGKAATVITATLVAVFFSGLADAGRISVPTRSGSAYAASTSTATRTGDVLRSGAVEGTYIPGYNQDRQIPVKVLNSNDFSVRRTFEAAADVLKSNKANAAAVMGTAIVAAAVAGIDWVQNEGMIVKKIPSGPVKPSSPNDYKWVVDGDQTGYATPMEACKAYYADTTALIWDSESQAGCQGKSPGSRINNAYRLGSTCPANSTYDKGTGACMGAGGTAPLEPSDWDKLQAALNSQSSAPDADPNFIKDLIRASCEGSLAPQRCYDSLSANGPGSASQSVSGPSSITLPTKSSTTLVKMPDGSTSSTTTTGSTVITITYGNNYYNYNGKTISTTTKPDGSTETTTEEDPDSPEEDTKYPQQPDPLTPVIKEYDKVSEAVKTPQQTVDGLTPKPWFSFGGSCQEIDFDSPIGRIKTSYCPTIESYVKPVLAFIFAISAYIYCLSIWRETTMTVRPT